MQIKLPVVKCVFWCRVTAAVFLMKAKCFIISFHCCSPIRLRSRFLFSYFLLQLLSSLVSSQFIVIVVVDSTSELRIRDTPSQFTLLSSMSTSWTRNELLNLHFMCTQHQQQWSCDDFWDGNSQFSTSEDVVGANKWPAFSHLTNKR